MFTAVLLPLTKRYDATVVSYPSKNLSKCTVDHVLGHGSCVADGELGVVHHFRWLFEQGWPKNTLVRKAVPATETLAENKHWPQSHLHETKATGNSNPK